MKKKISFSWTEKKSLMQNVLVQCIASNVVMLTRINAGKK